MIAAAQLQPLIDRLGDLASRVPHPSLPRRLNGLFAGLVQAQDDPHETMDLIWAIWCDHPVTALADHMEMITRAIAQKQFVEARLLLSGLQQAAPEWAEVWNKSATLYFLEQNDKQALVDIGHTLDLEPRHFGALAGLAEICLRHNEPDIARLAAAKALAINPHLYGLAARLRDIPIAQRH
jgi:Flp pilus assembly protein TadD